MPGRMNPPHIGHELGVNQVVSDAKKDKASHTILLTRSHDAKKNPLEPEEKLKFAKSSFPGAHIELASKESPTLLHHASDMHKKGVTHLVVHVGSDRVNEFHKLLHQYNGKEGRHGHYNFKHIDVRSIGADRDEGEGVAGASASKMRKLAAGSHIVQFKKNAPSAMSNKHKEEMYQAVRKGMKTGINESLPTNNASGTNVKGLNVDSTGGDLTNYVAGNIADSDQANNELFKRIAYHVANHRKRNS